MSYLPVSVGSGRCPLGHMEGSQLCLLFPSSLQCGRLSPWLVADGLGWGGGGSCQVGADGEWSTPPPHPSRAPGMTLLCTQADTPSVHSTDASWTIKGKSQPTWGLRGAGESPFTGA